MNRKIIAGILSILFAIIFLVLFIIIINKTKPIKIGFCGVLTGVSSELGISARNGLKIAIDNINRKGGIKGRKIELIIKDDEGKPDTGLSVVEELNQEGVIAIIGHITSSAASKSFDYINKNKILMISPTVSSSFYDDKDDYFIRVVSSNKIQANALANKIIKDNKKNIVVIYDLKNRLYTELTFNHFKIEFEKLGGKIVKAETFYSGENCNFYDIIKSLFSYKFDAFLLISSGLDTANICQQIRKFDKSINIYSAFWAMTEDLIIYGGKGVENIYIFGEFDIKDDSKEYKEFKEEYINRYKKTPSFSAIYAYESMRVLSYALNNSKKWDANSLKNSVINKEFNGLQKRYIINQYGDTYREYSLFTVKNGEFVKIE